MFCQSPAKLIRSQSRQLGHIQAAGGPVFRRIPLSPATEPAPMPVCLWPIPPWPASPSAVSAGDADLEAKALNRTRTLTGAHTAPPWPEAAPPPAAIACAAGIHWAIQGQIKGERACFIDCQRASHTGRLAAGLACDRMAAQSRACGDGSQRCAAAGPRARSWPAS